jgi:phytanoyl-CoA hydroxylase
MTQPAPAETTGLSPADIDRFWADGFLAFQGVFSPDEIQRLREAVEGQAINQKYKTADQTIHELALTQQHPLFLAMASDERIVGRLVPLLGPNVQIQHSKLAAKPLAKGVGPFGWHQDFAYFPHTNTDLIAVMVYLDDADEDNGCMNMVRGSHKLGLLNHTTPDGWFSGQCLEAEHWEAHPQNVVPLVLPAGSISMHHCLTLHGSPANLSGRPRRGLVIQYRAADAYQMADTVFPDTGIVVAGTRVEYARCTVGTVRLPKSRWRAARGEAVHGSAWNQIGPFAQQQNEQQGIK